MAPQTVQIWGSVQVASGPGVWPVASLASRRVRPQRVQVYWMTPAPLQVGLVIFFPSSQAWPRGSV